MACEKCVHKDTCKWVDTIWRAVTALADAIPYGIKKRGLCEPKLNFVIDEAISNCCESFEEK